MSSHDSITVSLKCSICGRLDEFPWPKNEYANVFDGSLTLDGGTAVPGWDVDPDYKVLCPDHTPKEQG